MSAITQEIIQSSSDLALGKLAQAATSQDVVESLLSCDDKNGYCTRKLLKSISTAKTEEYENSEEKKQFTGLIESIKAGNGGDVADVIRIVDEQLAKTEAGIREYQSLMVTAIHHPMLDHSETVLQTMIEFLGKQCIELQAQLEFGRAARNLIALSQLQQSSQ